MREIGAKAQLDVGAGSEGPKPVHVHLDASLDDAGDQPLDRRRVGARLLDDRLRALGPVRVVREHDEAAPRAIAINDADEVGADLENDARNLGVLGRLVRRAERLSLALLERRRFYRSLGRSGDLGRLDRSSDRGLGLWRRDGHLGRRALDLGRRSFRGRGVDRSGFGSSGFSRRMLGLVRDRCA
jgi:hypothetical protein